MAALKAGVSLVILAVVVGRIDLSGLALAAGGVSVPALAVVFGVYLVGQVLTAWRWGLLARVLGFREPFARVLRYYFVGMFFNLAGPATVGGDLVRAMSLAGGPGRRLAALQTVLADRLIGLAMLLVVALVAWAAFGGFGLPEALIAATAALAGGMIVGWLVAVPLARRLAPSGSRLQQLVVDAFGPLGRPRPVLAGACAVSLVFHCLQISALVLLGRAVGVDVDWRYFFIFHPLVTTASALPVSLAGLGIREAGYVWFLERQGVAAETAVAFGLLWFAVLVVASLVGGGVGVDRARDGPGLRGAAGRGGPT